MLICLWNATQWNITLWLYVYAIHVPGMYWIYIYIYIYIYIIKRWYDSFICRVLNISLKHSSRDGSYGPY